MTQLALGEDPQPVMCEFCLNAPSTQTVKAMRMCDTCATSTPIERARRWMQAIKKGSGR